MLHRKLPDWSFAEYFNSTLRFVSGSSSNKSGWDYFGAILACFVFAGAYIPLSILWFVVKNKFQVGSITWLLVALMAIAGIVFLCLASFVFLIGLAGYN